MARGRSAGKGRRGRRMRKSAHSGEITALAAAVAVLLICFLYFTDGNLLFRFVIAVAVLSASGSAIASANGISGSYGAYLFGGKRGIALIDSLSSRNRRIWNGVSDWGLALSFGLLSFALLRKQVSKKMIAFGLASMLAILVFVYPNLSTILSFITIPQLASSAAASASPAVQGAYLPYYLLMASAIIGGFSLFVIASLLYGAATILFASSQVPGVAPVIPGVTIPLFAGIISLVILLVCHEIAHGVQARAAKVRIKSTGMVMFGIIPIGAFVEPDERRIKRLGRRDQDRISIAGISANLLVSLAFFILLLLMAYLVMPYIGTGGVAVTAVVPGAPAYGVIATNSMILMWNGMQITNEYDLARAEAGYISGQVKVTTNSGTYAITPTVGGKLGIAVAPAVATGAFQVANFLYSIVVLSFGLNFFVALFNLLPLPGFDGWRIYQGRIRNKAVLNALAVFTIVVILVNALPWLNLL